MGRRHVVACVVLAAVLVALSYGAYRYRRGFIRGFFAPGPFGDPPSLAHAGVAGAPLAFAPRTRVVLLDGVGLATARGLPAYSAICRGGLDLVVDVGFPTVSLPVQRVLWTGLTQQQSGMHYVVRQQPPPAAGIPAQVAGSVAVAESHPEIVGSLGFAAVEVFGAADPPDVFARAAVAAVASAAPLAFVHILRVDQAGHWHGPDSAAYREAARTADALLAWLHAADPTARWFVLADHGHRPGGGHGGAEGSIRRVRACIAGGLPETLRPPPGRAIHLVDFARALADSTGVRLADEAVGRPLAVALAAGLPAGGALPSPLPSRWIAAALLLLAACVFTAWAARGRLASLPWWWPIAYLAVVVIEQAPTLSVPMVYKPLGRDMYVAALPGLCALAVLATLSLRQLSIVRVAVAQLALPAGIAGAALALAGAGSGAPPLMPAWTARASLYLVLAFTGTLVVALAVLATAVRPGTDRTTPARTRDSGA